MISGFYLFTDNKRILLSSLLIISPNENNPFYELPEPLFFYIAFILTIFGIIIVSVSFLGFWTSYIHNYCLLTIYFLLVLGLLLIEFAICLVIILWPQCLGLNLDTTEMVRRLQGYYGVPGTDYIIINMIDIIIFIYSLIHNMLLELTTPSSQTFEVSIVKCHS